MGSANGGYTCGLIADLLDADVVEVTLRRPPPLEVELVVERDGDDVRVLEGMQVVAEARPATLELEPPAAPSFAEAERLSSLYGDDPHHPFPGCFVCGPARGPGDALRLRPAPSGAGRVAASWRVEPEFASDRFVWAALDCPGGWAVQPDSARGLTVLGRLTGWVLDRPKAGDECVVIGWPLEREARKLHAGTAVYRDGELLGLGRAVWFSVPDDVRDPAV
jgi:hypothetical protein